MQNSKIIPNERDLHRLFSDFEIQTDYKILARRPDLKVVNKKWKPSE